MSLNVESNRASGRTTRMILKATEYLVKNPNKRVVIVSHDHRSTHWMKQYVESILNTTMAARFDYVSVDSTVGHEILQPNYFFDHHCFYAKRQKLMADLAWVNKQYGRWDE